MRRVGYMIATVIASIALSISVQAQIPRSITVQGVLTDPNGTFIPNGPHTLTFRLHDHATAGRVVHSESQSVVVINGLFNALIGGGGVPLPDSMAFDRAYFLGVSVDGGSEMSPRLPLTAVPYALRAQVATMAESLSPNVTGIVTTLNGASGALTLEGTGSAAVARSGDTIFITATGGGGGGSSFAAVQNADGSISVSRPTGPVATIGVADGGITTAKLAANAVTTAKIADGAISSEKLSDDAVTSAKIASGAVSMAKLADGSVSRTKLADSAVSTAKIRDGAVTQAKLAAGVSFPPTGTAGGDLTGSYPNPSIANGVVTNQKLAENAVTTSKIQNGTIAGEDVNPNTSLTVGKLTSAGTTVIGTTGPVPGQSMFTVKAAGNSGVTTAMQVRDSAGVSLLHVVDNGQIGIGTTNPGAMLDISSAAMALQLSSGGAVFTPVAVAAAGAITLPTTTVQIRVTDDGAIAPNVVVLAAGTPGQILIISNDDAQPLAGAVAIASGQTRMYVFVGGRWRVVT